MFKAGDIVSGIPNPESAVYINNHVTPYFGKLLHEGRKAVKNGDIYSCWVNSHGCQLKFEDNAKHHGYRSIDDLNKLIAANKKKPNTKKRAIENRSPSTSKSKQTK